MMAVICRAWKSQREAPALASALVRHYGGTLTRTPTAAGCGVGDWVARVAFLGIPSNRE